MKKYTLNTKSSEPSIFIKKYTLGNQQKLENIKKSNDNGNNTDRFSKKISNLDTPNIKSNMVNSPSTFHFSTEEN